jgi:hypothetical protein
VFTSLLRKIAAVYFSGLALSVIAYAMPPLPKGEALAAPGKVSDFVRSSHFGGAVERSETERVRMAERMNLSGITV